MNNLGSMIYECERLGTKQEPRGAVSASPEIRCKYWGYRVLNKARPSLPKMREHAVYVWFHPR